MRLAVIADIHANAVALEAVRASLHDSDVDRVVCLGDLVGYNAEPAECLGRIRDLCNEVVAGNHDVDVARGDAAMGTNGAARAVQSWTRDQLHDDDIEYLATLPRIIRDPGGRFVAVHGCYLNDHFYSGYVTGTMLEENLSAVSAANERGTIAFCGHTHVPLVGWSTEFGVVESKAVNRVQWPEYARAILVNPGSVGQPRDGDYRSSFAVVDLDGRWVEFRRVSYDVGRAADAIVAAGLPESLATRLMEGR